MRFAVIADSHDHLSNIQAAVASLQKQGIDTWLHLGDFVAPFVAKPLQQLMPPALLLFGNNDGERLGLAKAFGRDIAVGPQALDLGGWRVFAMHEPYALDAAVQSGLYDLVCYGHLHQVELRRVGRSIVLNPGELCGWLSGQATYAVVDTMSGEVVIYDSVGREQRSLGGRH